MKRILIYGFSGFDRFPRNPSRDAVTDLARRRFAGAAVETVIFRVAYEHVAHKVPRLLAKTDYDAVIGFGLARGAGCIRLEKEARNLILSKTADVDGNRPGRRRIIRGAPECFRSRVNLTRLRAALIQAEIPAVISHDAGGYVCNFTYFHFLQRLRAARSRARCLFVHLPLSEEIARRMPEALPCLPQEHLNNAAAVVVKQLISG